MDLELITEGYYDIRKNLLRQRRMYQFDNRRNLDVSIRQINKSWAEAHNALKREYGHVLGKSLFWDGEC